MFYLARLARLRLLVPVVALIGLSLLLSNSAQAVKYMSLEQAVKKFLPKGSKIVKITKKPSAQERKRLADEYGWKADAKKYVFYAGKKGEDYTGFVFIVPEIFGTCFHKYAVGINPEGQVIATTIVELSCPRAMPVNKKTFLKQFKGKTHQDPLTVAVDIDGVTGATYSSEATATATRKALSLHNLYFGKGEHVHLSEKVRKERAARQAAIDAAAARGEMYTEEQKAQFAKEKAQKEQAANK